MSVILLQLVMLQQYVVQAEQRHSSSQRSAQQENNVPELSIPSELSVVAGTMITVPVAFKSHEQEISGIGFSIDYDQDQDCLRIDPSDDDGDGLPDSITSAIPPQFSLSVSINEQDGDGEIDIVIADFSPPLAALSDTEALVTLQFTASCQPTNPEGRVAEVKFSSQPAVSFSDPSGREIAGRAIDGSVLVLPDVTFTPPSTYTPTPSPTATSTLTPTPTEITPTITPTTTVVSTVTPTPAVNPPPTVVGDSVTIDEDTSVEIDVLQNDSDPDNDPLIISQFTQAEHGTVELRGNDRLTYRPNPNYSGADSFTYTASDGKGGTNIGTVTITIREINDPPSIIVRPSDQSNSVGDEVMIQISANDPDKGPQALTYSAEGLPAGVEIDAQSGAISGVLAGNSSGIYEPTIIVSDGDLSDSIKFGWEVVGRGDDGAIYLPLIER